jgi:hypothetical protein
MKLRWIASLLLVLACGDEERRQFQIPTMDECFGMGDRVLCNAGTALICQGGAIASRDECTSRGLTCFVGSGCSSCAPNAFSCEGAKRYQCAADGSAKVLLEECAADLQCSAGGCKNLCADAVADRSYLGCDYWPVFTVNSELPVDFKPAVAVGNGNLVPAHVTITRAGAPVAELDVPPLSAQTVELTADMALREATGSLLLRGAAYHLVSSAPVTVHQFNPLNFELPFDCTIKEEEREEYQRDGKCNSYTNDASLLFPSTSLGPDVDHGASSVEFYAMSRAAFMSWHKDEATTVEGWAGLPSFVAITGVGTQRAHVRVETKAFVAASAPGSAQTIAALDPGGSLEVDLEPGDVLQLVTPLASCRDDDAEVDGPFCDPGPRYDMTGTRVIADGAVQVIAGVDCSRVPFNRVACDHLEESMTPLSTWGTTAVLSVPTSSAAGQYMMRVLSGADDNTITFDPPLQPPVTLARGETVEFGASSSLSVHGSKRMLVAQYLVGANGALLGDPSLTLAAPVDQYRQSYNFLTPSTYTQNVVDVIALDTDVVTVDGNLVTDFQQVGSTRYKTASVPLLSSGAHEARGAGASGFGIVVYGLGSYTSYMLPGGLALKPIIYGY